MIYLLPCSLKVQKFSVPVFSTQDIIIQMANDGWTTFSCGDFSFSQVLKLFITDRIWFL